MDNHIYPLSYERATGIRVYINGAEAEVFRTEETCFAPVQYQDAADVKIVTDAPIGTVQISPQRENIPFSAGRHTVSFSLEKNQNLFLTMSGFPLPLLFYGNPPEAYDGRADFYFPGGQIYEVGELRLTSNQSVYIERGAVVKGRIVADHAENIKIYGYGILDNSYYEALGESCKTIRMIACQNVTIEHIILVRPTTWMIALAGCSRVRIDGIKEIGEVVSSDGIDLVGCCDVTIENCMLRNNDDCIVVKHTLLDTEDPAFLNLLKPCGGILAQNCVLFNGNAGNAVEIGHELRCEEISGVTFRDLDILRVDGLGAAISIHVGDQATVRDILFENIYIEHYYEKLIDFRVMRSMYNVSEERGQIRDIVLKDIYVTKSTYNHGYSVSCIGGYDDGHTAGGIRFINFCLNNEPVKNADMLDLFTKNTFDITFE